MKEFIKNLIVEGSRVFWTAVEAAAGIVGAIVIPDTALDFLGPFEPAAIVAAGVAIAAVATWLKELARGRLTPVE